MLRTNRLINQVSEYWYIGSIRAKSVVQKYNIDPRTATTRYKCLVASMSQHVNVHLLGFNMHSAK